MSSGLKKYLKKTKQDMSRLYKVEEKYHELIMAVESKCPSETRHETALRYIRDRETMKVDAIAATL